MITNSSSLPASSSTVLAFVAWIEILDNFYAQNVQRNLGLLAL
ncbi:7422_t:CDS:2 [Racocetra fulgida]|uniref:7422_t:CDS:1 n=1 Tax=Racocetra fulgida TaxID=60492 RepID=A0A9N9BV66_9GLOM|nr:7422_t:CDS:2 [Racocetra fulgida]